VGVTVGRNAVPEGMRREGIRLEGVLDIGGATELKQVLLQALESPGPARIALEAVTEMDVTAMQLLWAAEQEARRSGKALALEGRVPEALRNQMQGAGFERVPFAEEPEAKDGE